MHNFSATELQRYAKQIVLNEIGLNGQSNLKKARVLCIGAGGIGSPLLTYLTAAGIGRLGIVDPDSVELSNLQRQVMYKTANLQQPKAIAAKQALAKLNPFVQVDTFTQAINTQNAAIIIENYDLVVDGTDNFTTKYLIHDTCFKQNKAYFYASASKFSGQFALFKRGHGACLHCVFPNTSLQNNCNSEGVIGTNPGLMGIIQATEVIKWLSGAGQNLQQKLLLTDLLNIEFKTINLEQDPECNVCVHSKFPKVTNNHEHFTKFAVDAKDFRKFCANNTNLQLIDVREFSEHNLENIGGICIPLDSLAHTSEKFSHNQPILVYCASDKRSIMGLQTLMQRGFKNVKYLQGGCIKLCQKNTI